MRRRKLSPFVAFEIANTPMRTWHTHSALTVNAKTQETILRDTIIEDEDLDFPSFWSAPDCPLPQTDGEKYYTQHSSFYPFRFLFDVFISITYAVNCDWTLKKGVERSGRLTNLETFIFFYSFRLFSIKN